MTGDVFTRVWFDVMLAVFGVFMVVAVVLFIAAAVGLIRDMWRDRRR